MNDVFIGCYMPLITEEENRYYNAVIRLMDYVDRNEKRLPIIYILNVKNVIYKVYDGKFHCIFICKRENPDVLLEAAIELMPKKIVLLNPLSEGVSRTLMLLFNCVEYDRPV